MRRNKSINITMHIGQMLTKSQHYQKDITQQGGGRPIMSVQMQWHPVADLWAVQ
jgi:hypothetical protein